VPKREHGFLREAVEGVTDYLNWREVLKSSGKTRQSRLEAFGVEVPPKIHDRERRAHEVPRGPIRHLGVTLSSRRALHQVPVDNRANCTTNPIYRSNETSNSVI